MLLRLLSTKAHCLRHDILLALLEAQHSTTIKRAVGPEIEEISYSAWRLAEMTGASTEDVRLQLESLMAYNHVEIFRMDKDPKDALFFVNSHGVAAAGARWHLLQGRDEASETFKAAFTYISVPASLIGATIGALVVGLQQYRANDLEKRIESLEQGGPKIELLPLKPVSEQQSSPSETVEAIDAACDPLDGVQHLK